jgi:peptide/nickel transport system substrate-binding protein
MRIVSTDPPVVEWYADDWSLNAEQSTGTFGGRTLWPWYARGEASWHQLAIGLLAEEKQQLAFSSDKATNLEIEWMNYIAGPSLEILGEQLTEAVDTNFIPYAPTLGQYVTEEEAAQRYANLQQFNERQGHFWIGTGPFYLQRAFPVEGTVILQRYPEYPDPAARYSGFAAAPVPVVEIDGPGRVTIGEEVTYDVFVDFAGEPYANEDISGVTYLVFDASGALVAQGDAVAESDGYFTVTLGSDVTEGLEAGSNTLEIVVVSNLVALPGSASFEFVTAP